MQPGNNPQYGVPTQQIQYGGQPQQMVMGQPMVQPMTGQPAVGMGMPKTNATLALVLSIVSIFFGSICLAIPGWILANGAIRITDAYPGHPDAGTAKIAKIIAILVTILTVIVVIGMLIMIVWANSLAMDQGY